MKYKIPNYSEDMSVNVGLKNLNSIKNGKGKIKFTGAFIHLAPICNFRCKGCYTHMEIAPKRRLNLKTIKEIVNFAKDRGAKSIIFAGAGEPTLDPEFEKIVKYIKDKGLQVVLFTNLTTLKSEKKAEQLLKNGPVIAKLLTLNEEKYNKITNFPRAFESAMSGLSLLLKAKANLKKKKVNSTLIMDCYIIKENYMDIPDLLRYCRKNEIVPYFETFVEIGQSKKIIKELMLSEKKLAKLFLKLQKIDKDEFNIDIPIHPMTRSYGQEKCNKATHMFGVKDDGNVCMCICTSRRVGNVFDLENPYSSLEKIFNIKNKWLLDYFVCDKCSKVINPKYLK